MPTCLISAGGNVGDVPAAINTAVRELDGWKGTVVAAVSSLRLTMPVGQQAGDPFFNAAIRLETDLPPIELLDRLQTLEAAAGRVRTLRWGPRPLDLDLILYGESTLFLREDGEPATSDADVRLIVPHPDAWYRRFVLDPSVEIAGELRHPTRHGSMQDLRNRLELRRIGLVSLDKDFPVAVIHSMQESSPGIVALLEPSPLNTASRPRFSILLQLDPLPESLAFRMQTGALTADRRQAEPTSSACDLYMRLPVEQRLAMRPGQAPSELIRDLVAAAFPDVLSTTP